MRGIFLLICNLQSADSNFVSWRKGLAKDFLGLVYGWNWVKTSFVQFTGDVKEEKGWKPEIIPRDQTRQPGNPKDGPTRAHLLVERANQISEHRVALRFADIHLGVCRNGVTPKWMVYKGNPYSNGWFWGTPIHRNPHLGSFSSIRPNLHRFWSVVWWAHICAHWFASQDPAGAQWRRWQFTAYEFNLSISVLVLENNLSEPLLVPQEQDLFVQTIPRMISRFLWCGLCISVWRRSE